MVCPHATDVRHKEEEVLPRHDELALKEFLKEWLSASASRKVLIVIRKLMFIIIMGLIIIILPQVIESLIAVL